MVWRSCFVSSRLESSKKTSMLFFWNTLSLNIMKFTLKILKFQENIIGSTLTVWPKVLLELWIELKLIKSNWNWTNWIEIDQIELKLIKLNWNWSNWIEIDQIELKLIKLNWNWSNWIEIDQIELKLIKLNWNWSNWIEIDQIELKLIKLNWNWSNWIISPFCV